MDASRDVFAPLGLSGPASGSGAPLAGLAAGLFDGRSDRSGASAASGGSDALGTDAAAALFRPTCDAAIESPGSTSLKWGHDGELTAQDLHHVLARLLERDQEACRMMDDDSLPPSADHL